MYLLSGTIGGRVVKLHLKRGLQRMGRGSRNDIDLNDHSVSREHAEIVVAGDRVELRDLGSSNGTYVNQRSVTDSVEVRPGDMIRFGSLELTLLSEGISVTPAPSTVPGAHTEMISLREQTQVSMQDSLSLEEARGGRSAPTGVDQTLLRVVSEAGQILVVPHPLGETFDLVLGLVERAIPARRILLLLTDTPDGSLAIRAARPSTELAGEELMLSRTVVETVLHDQATLLLNDAQSDPRFQSQESVILQNLRAAMVAPLFDNAQVIGLLYADGDDPRIHYDRNQLRAFTLLANLIAVKITNTRLLEAQREKERMEQEAAEAAQVQQQLLSTELPSIPGYEIIARQIPCFEVAGDLYEVTELEDGRVAIVVGDVTGKGMGAALLMSNVIAALRVLYQELPELSTLAERLHRQLLRSSDEIHFVTLFLGLLDPQTHRLEYINAGHNAPFLMCGDDEPETLPATGMPMGLLPGATYETRFVDLPAGSLLCVFSDGIPEAMVGEEFYGEDRFLQSAKERYHQPLDEIADGALQDVQDFLGDHRLEDDVTLVLLRRQ